MVTLGSVGVLRNRAAHHAHHIAGIRHSLTAKRTRHSSGKAQLSNPTTAEWMLTSSRRFFHFPSLLLSKASAPYPKASAPYPVSRSWSTYARPETSSKVQDAVRKHREIQNLMQGPASSSTPKTTEKVGAAPSLAVFQQQQREQRRRQAIINSTLSFLVVLLAAQGVKNGEDRRKAQEGQQHAENELREIRNRLRQMLTSDELLRSLARDSVAVIETDTTVKNPRTTMWGAIFSPHPRYSSKEIADEKLHRVAEVLAQGVASQLSPLLMSDDERERREMEELVQYPSSTVSMVNMTQEGESARTHLDSSSTISSVPDQVGDDCASQCVARSKPKRVFAF